MFRIQQTLDLEWKHVACGLAVSALSGLALLAAAGEAEAGYTCVSNATQIGNSVTIEVVSTSGGTSFVCLGGMDADTGPANISVSGTVTSVQVGATAGSVRARSVAVRQGLGANFEVLCTHSPVGCSSSASGFINGVDVVQCLVDGGEFLELPDPALPLVPVVITSVCTVNY